MGVDPSEYKNSLRKFASGVGLVTVATNGNLHGMTVSSFASLSLDPPLVVACLENGSRTRAMVFESRAFSVNILAAHQTHIARAFAAAGPKTFDGLAFHSGRKGAPLLDDAIAWIECDVQEIVDGGDHDIVVGEVMSCTANEGTPLLYFDRHYHSFEGMDDPT
jgi:flavin reductase (DIM6/NTAB) family NADH-FMN oxidoreductase RutF